MLIAIEVNDGEYGVRMGDLFCRVDNDRPVERSSSLNASCARLGREGRMEVAIAEKAVAHHRTRANSDASIEGGLGVE